MSTRQALRVKENNLIPFRPFLAVNLFGVVFVRKDQWEEMTDTEKQRTLRHEAIHSAQGRELLWIGFYLAYLLEWLGRLITSGKGAYGRISFEREAYGNDWKTEYRRKHFAQWR